MRIYNLLLPARPDVQYLEHQCSFSCALSQRIPLYRHTLREATSADSGWVKSYSPCSHGSLCDMEGLPLQHPSGHLSDQHELGNAAQEGASESCS